MKRNKNLSYGNLLCLTFCAQIFVNKNVRLIKGQQLELRVTKHVYAYILMYIKSTLDVGTIVST